MKKRKEVTISGKTIGDNHPAQIVAELGVNHLGDMETMRKMIETAHLAGADFLKFQTFDAKKRYDRKTNPEGEKFISMLSKWQFSKQQEQELWQYARSLGATAFTSVFDTDTIEFTEHLETPAYKLAAFELLNLELVQAVSMTKKPVVVSRGMTTQKELDAVINIFEKYGTPYIILHCISSYPCKKTDVNLKMIHTLRENYDCPIGFSDHTYGIEIPPFALAAGANMIEKHYTVSNKLMESDNFFSVTPEDFEEMVYEIRKIEKYLGHNNISKIDAEDYMLNFRRITKPK